MDFPSMGMLSSELITLLTGHSAFLKHLCHIPFISVITEHSVPISRFLDVIGVPVPVPIPPVSQRGN